MAQKINPTNNKLGILQIWNYQFSKYGKSFENYNKAIRSKDYVTSYVKRFLFQNDSLVENIKFIFSAQQITIAIFVFNASVQSLEIKDKALASAISFWLNDPLKILIFQTKNFSNSAFLVSNYIIYLLSLRTVTLKQILQLVYGILKKQVGKVKPVYVAKGLQLIKFKGFKLEFTGCFESSRSQMSKTLKCSFGSIPLTKLKGYVEYSNNYFPTKFGLCSLKLWVFYELL